MIVELRKLQNSKTGLYVTIPANVGKELGLTGQELIKFTLTDDKKIILEPVKI